MYKEVRTLDKTDAAYIAGLIDGGGTVTLSHRHRNENRHLVVSISNTDLPLLEYMLNTIGAGKITSKKTTQYHHTPSFTYAIFNRQAIALLQQTLPYLRTYKAKRSKIILGDYVRLTPGNGRYTSDIKRARDEFEEGVMSITY